MTVAAPTDHDIIALRRGIRLQWEQHQQAWVILFPEGMVTLNDSASAILRLCQDEVSVGTLIATLQQQFPDANLAADVREFLATALQENWLVITPDRL
ncbi:MAG: pyrroloquinoline quinone biosynthesis peptide chaperone PqqD [Pseudomonadota bacterium]|nr:pyrroloquinoline quinone biosynthesis peptide chaperone PqqD [Pseudomonadota bacterium]